VISKEKAQHYVDEMYKWLESFGLGFKADDRSTWHIANVPKFDKGGLYHRYGVGHEQFAWDIRTEPGVVAAFAKIWGTDELVVSYDSVNISLPYGAELPCDQLGRLPPHACQAGGLEALGVEGQEVPHRRYGWREPQLRVLDRARHRYPLLPAQLGVPPRPAQVLGR
jgi:hypothetical protein